MVVVIPPDLTVATLNGASGDQLRTRQILKVRNKSGKVKDLRMRLAVHYGLARAAPTKSATPTSPVPLDKAIQVRRRAAEHLIIQSDGHTAVTQNLGDISIANETIVA